MVESRSSRLGPLADAGMSTWRAADRVHDVWGSRTATRRGDRWPERVDLALESGLSSTDVDWVQSACVLCSNGCGCDIAVKDGRMRGFEVEQPIV